MNCRATATATAPTTALDGEGGGTAFIAAATHFITSTLDF